LCCRRIAFLPLSDKPQGRFTVAEFKVCETQDQRLMEEEKRKNLEAKLNLLFAQIDQQKDSEDTKKKEVQGIRLIRRRKGNPDKHIA
jgi:hypothetical protein